MGALVIRGDPKKRMTLFGTASTTTPVVGSEFTVTTLLAAHEYVASGVHLARTSLPRGLVPVSVETTREDGVTMNFVRRSEVTVGNIHEGDSRSVIWTFRATTPGEKRINFRAWSENAGTRAICQAVKAVRQ